MANSKGITFGSTIVFGTSAFSAEVLSIGIDGISRSALDTSHIGLTVYDTGESAYRTFRPGGLIDPGELTIGINWTMEDEPPISKAAEEIVVTFAGTGGTSDGTLTFSGFLTGYNVSGELDGAYEGEVTVKCTGDPAWVDSA